jgi:hypothetical protein
MSLADLFTWTQSAVFDDLDSDRHATQIRRNLQRTYARMLARLATTPAAGTPLDAQALARVELTDVAAKTKRALARRGLDLQTRAHLAALDVETERALDAKIALPVTAL